MSTSIENAIISKASIALSDHGELLGSVEMAMEHSNQSYGAYVLYSTHVGENLAGRFIFRCMQIAGVEDWSRMKGAIVRVRREDRAIMAIGHIINNDWYSVKDEYDQSLIQEGGSK